MTKEILEGFKKQGDTSEMEAKDVKVIVKFFDPCGSWTWYATEFNETDGIFFGFVRGFDNELGSFSLAELEGYKNKFGLGIERDLHFRNHTLAECMEKQL